MRGAENLLRHNDCFLQIEAWPENAVALKAYMENLGYRFLDVIEEDYYFAKTSPRT